MQFAELEKDEIRVAVRLYMSGYTSHNVVQTVEKKDKLYDYYCLVIVLPREVLVLELQRSVNVLFDQLSW